VEERAQQNENVENFMEAKGFGQVWFLGDIANSAD